jgi:hypothetical protein
MIATCTSQNSEAIHSAGHAGPAAQAAVISVCSASPPIRLDAEPAAGNDRAQQRRDAGAADAEAGAAQHRERHAVLGAGMGVQHHRHQHHDVAEEDRAECLPPRHPLLHQAGGQRVGGDDHGHPDPQRGDVVGRPGSLFEPGRREIGVPERAAGDVLGELDEVGCWAAHPPDATCSA